MARRFALVSFGVLCLVVAYQLLASKANADWDASMNGNVVGIAAQNFGVHRAWSRDGKSWFFVTSDMQWHEYSYFDLPVPMADVKFIDGDDNYCLLVTKDDRVFATLIGQNGWNAISPVPEPPVSADSPSWGSVRSLFRDAAK